MCDYRQDEILMVGRIEAEVPRNHSHASQIAPDRFVLHGGLISKVNHSCSPNCSIHVNDTGAHDFVARHHIPGGAELTFDYAMRNFTIEYFPERCRCGAAGLPRISLHSLRRTWEDLLREAGVDDLVRRAMACWRSPGAQAIYASVDRRERDAAVGALLAHVTGGEE